MQSLVGENPHRHLLEHAAIVAALALLTIWWWMLTGDGFRQFGSFAILAEVVSHPAYGMGFPTLMISSDRPTGAIGPFIQWLSYVLGALLWMNGPVWLAIAIAGPVRHKLGLHADDAMASGIQGSLSFRRALPEYFVAMAASALWGAYKYSQLVAVTADEALRFLLLYALPATLLPLAIMALRRWVVAVWRRLRARSATA